MMSCLVLLMKATSISPVGLGQRETPCVSEKSERRRQRPPWLRVLMPVLRYISESLRRGMVDDLVSLLPWVPSSPLPTWDAGAPAETDWETGEVEPDHKERDLSDSRRLLSTLDALSCLRLPTMSNHFWLGGDCGGVRVASFLRNLLCMLPKGESRLWLVGSSIESVDDEEPRDRRDGIGMPEMVLCTRALPLCSASSDVETMLSVLARAV